MNANGNAAAVSFDYGTAITYGTNVAGAPASVTGNTATPVSATLTNLMPGTTYYFRALGTSVGGPGTGGDLTFTTLSNNANLSALALSAGTLSPIFAGGTTGYTAHVPRMMTSVNITPTLADGNASMAVNAAPATSGSPVAANLNIGVNNISILVTAQDGVTVKNYTLALTRRTHTNRS